jgi:hypothetical protein
MCTHIPTTFLPAKGTDLGDFPTQSILGKRDLLKRQGQEISPTKCTGKNKIRSNFNLFNCSAPLKGQGQEISATECKNGRIH